MSFTKSMLLAAMAAVAFAPALHAQENNPSTAGGSARADRQENRETRQNDRQHTRDARQDVRQDRREELRDRVREGATQARENIRGAIDSARADGVGINRDPLIVEIVSLGNRGEISLAQAAHEKLQSPEVRKFAQRLIEDHTMFQQKLDRALANEDGRATAARPTAQPTRLPGAATEVAGPSTTEVTDTDQTAARAETKVDAGATRIEVQRPVGDSATTTERSASGAQPGVGRAVLHQALTLSQSPLMQMQRDIKQKQQAMMEKELNEHQGAHFDQAFLGQQIGCHIEMLSTLQALQPHASPQLAQVLSDGAAATQQHLQLAKQLMKNPNASADHHEAPSSPSQQ